MAAQSPSNVWSAQDNIDSFLFPSFFFELLLAWDMCDRQTPSSVCHFSSLRLVPWWGFSLTKASSHQTQMNRFYYVGRIFWCAPFPVKVNLTYRFFFLFFGKMPYFNLLIINKLVWLPFFFAFFMCFAFISVKTYWIVLKSL